MTYDPMAHKNAETLLHVYLLCAKENLTLVMDAKTITVTLSGGKVFKSDITPAGDKFEAESAIYKLLRSVKAALKEEKELAFDEKVLHDDYLSKTV